MLFLLHKEPPKKKLKIAWRYENQSPKAEEFSGKVTNHHFNLNKTVSQDALTDVLTHWSFDSMSFDTGNIYHGLYNDISQAVESFKIDPKAPGTNMMRIGISDIGSALLSCPNDGTTALMLFLYRLRALARSHLIVIVLTLSNDFFVNHEENSSTHRRLTELVDFAFSLTAFGKEERQNGLFKDHHGLIELVKAAPLNCLQNAHVSVGTKHLFKSLRTKFSISPMHLPPDLVYAVDAIVRLEHTPHLDLEDVIAAGSRPGVGTDHAAAPHAHDRSTGRSARPGRPARPHRPRYVHR